MKERKVYNQSVQNYKIFLLYKRSHQNFYEREREREREREGINYLKLMFHVHVNFILSKKGTTCMPKKNCLKF